MVTRIRVVPAPEDVHREFARAIASEIARNNKAGRPTRLILPVGPTAHYPALAKLCNENDISWRTVRFTTMDEYLDWTGRPVPTSHPLSFTGYMQRFLLTLDPQVRPPQDAFVWPDPFDIDRVERFVEDMGGVDTCYGGIGVHGHVAFNEPPLSRFGVVSDDEFVDSPTRVVALAPETLVMNATRSARGRFADFPPMAVTIGMREIMGAARIRLFCDGGVWQQEAVRRAVHGPAGTDYPVSLLSRHPDVAIVADSLTASSTAAPGDDASVAQGA
jgi:glucosamine-6-phosphate deaminase